MQLADECKIPEPDRVESPILDHKFGEETFGSLIGLILHFENYFSLPL